MPVSRVSTEVRAICTGLVDSETCQAILSSGLAFGGVGGTVFFCDTEKVSVSASRSWKASCSSSSGDAAGESAKKEKTEEPAAFLRKTPWK